MRVFVKNMRGEALMPCSNRKARILLKQKKAKIIGYHPFTIQLQYATGEANQEVTIGVKADLQNVGIAVTSGEKVFAKGQIELRQDVKSLLKTRAIYRRGRRFRKTRHRKARFLNRKHKDGWLWPSVQGKLNANFHWIDVFRELVPSPKLRISVMNLPAEKNTQGRILPPVVWTLRKRMMQKYPQAEIVDRCDLSAKCLELGLSRAPYNMALVLNVQKLREDSAEHFLIKQFRKKKRSLHEAMARKGRKEPNRTQRRNGKNTKTSRGWFLNDEVSYLGKRGWITGFTGVSAYVLDATGKYLQIPGRKYKMITLSRLTRVCHNNNWQYSVQTRSALR